MMATHTPGPDGNEPAAPDETDAPLENFPEAEPGRPQPGQAEPGSEEAGRD